MKLSCDIIFITILLFKLTLSADVCVGKTCKCSERSSVVHCDEKGWTNLTDIEFPSNVATLSLVNNKLKFDTTDDRTKIEQLTSLINLILNGNPLGAIPPLNDLKIRSLSLLDTLLKSAEFPSTYTSSFLKTISISKNRIDAIQENDFLALKNSKVNQMHIDSTGISTIHPNAFIPLMELQSLSLKNNKLKSCDFLSTFRLLSSIHLDGNQFTSLPQQLSTPKTIKNFFFTNNSISVIDDSSPLNLWVKQNYTNIKLYLANNPFDCCQSLWFIQLLNSSAHFIGDAQLLTCATPSKYAGRQLVTLNPNEMECNGIQPNKPWWPTAIFIVSIIVSLVTIIGLIIFGIIKVRNRRSRSGYTEIDGTNDPIPDPPSPSSTHPSLPFPASGQDYDTYSEYSTVPSAYTVGSHVTSASTHIGASVNDGV